MKRAKYTKSNRVAFPAGDLGNLMRRHFRARYGYALKRIGVKILIHWESGIVSLENPRELVRT